MPDPEYVALRDKVDAFVTAASARRRDAIVCRAGCDGCCRVQLSVCDVEADAVREALDALDDATIDALAAELPVRSRCRLLDPDGRCRIYAARPLVCRTQGQALRYPRDQVPVDAIRARSADGDVTWCPLSFDGTEPPRPDDVLDAERVDLILAVVNRRHAEDPARRTPLSELVNERLERS